MPRRVPPPKVLCSGHGIFLMFYNSVFAIFQLTRFYGLMVMTAGFGSASGGSIPPRT